MHNDGYQSVNQSINLFAHNMTMKYKS